MLGKFLKVLVLWKNDYQMPYLAQAQGLVSKYQKSKYLRSAHGLTAAEILELFYASGLVIQDYPIPLRISPTSIQVQLYALKKV